MHIDNWALTKSFSMYKPAHVLYYSFDWNDLGFGIYSKESREEKKKQREEMQT